MKPDMERISALILAGAGGLFIGLSVGQTLTRSALGWLTIMCVVLITITAFYRAFAPIQGPRP